MIGNENEPRLYHAFSGKTIAQRRDEKMHF